MKDKMKVTRKAGEAFLKGRRVVADLSVGRRSTDGKVWVVSLLLWSGNGGDQVEERAVSVGMGFHAADALCHFLSTSSSLLDKIWQGLPPDPAAPRNIRD